MRRALAVVAACLLLTPVAPATAAPRVTKVLTIVEENHGSASAYAGMPYLRHLADTYGRADDYRSLTHPSLPNYLAMAGGSTFGLHDDGSHRLSGRTVFDVAGKTYAEGMTTPCRTTATGRYVPRHNPWTSFTGSRAACLKRDVPAGTTGSGNLRDDVARGTLPTVGMLVPDLCHDAHDCSLATADAWLRSWVQVIAAGPDYKAGRLAIAITFDEVEGRGQGRLLTVVVWPGLAKRHATVRLDHYAWCRWMTDLAHVAPVREAAHAPSLGTAFRVT